MYKRSRKLRQQEKQQVVRLEEQVNSLMTDITEIKQLLTQLVRD
jgi:regulator of replication initiation timing